MTQSAGQVRILNGLALCQMRQGQWQDAEGTLQEAYEKDAKNPETLANLITVGLHLAKNVSRYTRCRPTVCMGFLMCHLRWCQTCIGIQVRMLIILAQQPTWQDVIKGAHFRNIKLPAASAARCASLSFVEEQGHQRYAATVAHDGGGCTNGCAGHL